MLKPIGSNRMFVDPIAAVAGTLGTRTVLDLLDMSRVGERSEAPGALR